MTIRREHFRGVPEEELHRLDEEAQHLGRRVHEQFVHGGVVSPDTVERLAEETVEGTAARAILRDRAGHQ